MKTIIYKSKRRVYNWLFYRTISLLGISLKQRKVKILLQEHLNQIIRLVQAILTETKDNIQNKSQHLTQQLQQQQQQQQIIVVWG